MQIKILRTIQDPSFKSKCCFCDSNYIQLSESILKTNEPYWTEVLNRYPKFKKRSWIPVVLHKIQLPNGRIKILCDMCAVEHVRNPSL